MTKLLTLALALMTTTAFGQTTNPTQPLKVEYINAGNQPPEPAIYLNDQLISKATILTIDPKIISNMNVVKNDKQINGVTFSGEIHITTKSDYTPNLISLTNLKARYTNLGSKHAIFMIDGTLVNTDFDKCLVDENYLLKIVVENLKNAKENIDLNVIKLFTKSEENLKRARENRIHGGERTNGN